MSDTQPEPATYAHRCCPACGSDRRDQQSVHSDPPAEQLPFKRVLEQWETHVFNVKTYFSSFRCGECGLLYCPYYPPPLGNIPAIVHKKNGHPHSSSTRDSV